MSSLQESLEKLNDFSLGDLDPENMGSWPLPVKVVSGLLIVIVVGFLGFQFYLSDLNSSLKNEMRTEGDLKHQFQTKAFLATNLNTYKMQMREMEASFGALLRQLPSDTEVPGLLEDITYTGLSAGLKIDAINLLPEVRHEFYVELPININVRGSYHDIGSFVSGVANLPRIVTLHDFEVKKDDEMVGVLSMEIKASTYRYSDQGGAK